MLKEETLVGEDLNPEERQRRLAILSDIDRRIREDGVRVAREYPDRARQFMPFDALRGFGASIAKAEREAASIQ